MAKQAEFTFNATKPFYAYVGAAESAVDAVRKAAVDVQGQLEGARTKLATLDRDPMVLAEKGRAQLVTGLETVTKEANKRIDELQADLRQLPVQAQARVAELRSDVVALPGKVEERLAELQGDLKAVYARWEAQLAELATKGESRVAKLRDDSISGDVEILRDDAEVVKEVDVDVEAAAAVAAEQAEAATKVVPPAAERTRTKKA